MITAKNRFKKVAILCLAFVISFGFLVQPTFADYSGWGPVKHSGKYYFKYNYGNNRLYISTKKTKGYKKTTVNSYLFATNGKEVMYVGRYKGRDYIKSYSISSKKTRRIKKLAKSEVQWEVCAARGHYLWLQKNRRVYRYNINTRKLTLVKKNVYFIQHLRGSYYFSRYGTSKLRYSDIKTSFGAVYTYVDNGAIYQATKDGKLRLVKSFGKITEYGTDPEAMVQTEGKINKVLYITADAHTVYRVKYNGKDKKKMVTFNNGVIYSVDSDSCYVAIKGVSYRYVFATKKMTEWDY